MSECDADMDFMEEQTAQIRQPFCYIRKTDPAHLFNFIQAEHPQTIALILSYLEPNKASVILKGFPRDIQSEVARRIAIMGRVSPEVSREVERVLEKKISTLSSEEYSDTGGVKSIVEILNLGDRASEKLIIKTLEGKYPELAEKIKKRMPFFKRCKLWWDTKLHPVLPVSEDNDD